MAKQYLYIFIVFLGACNKVTISPPTTVTTFRSSGLDVSWDQSGSNRIAYDCTESNGYYAIHIANPDGSNDTCLTCNDTALPDKNICCPYWHPSGKWLLMVVEKENHPGTSTDALPGFGAYCDIWLISSDGTKAYLLVDEPNDYNHGVICPRFSPNGNKIEWTERTAAPNLLNPIETAGFWTIKTADFSFGADSVPVVGNVTILQPGPAAFYECYGYSPDGSRLIFCSDMNQLSFANELIYTMDTNGNNLLQLTQSNYNEHAFYKPDGSEIVFMSNTNSSAGGTDWWGMNPDGSGKTQLTYFNEPNSPEWAGGAVWAGLGSFSPDGSEFVGGVQLNLVTQAGKIVRVQLLP